MRTLFALSLLGLTLGGSGCSIVRGPSKNKGEILFSHALHVAQADCAECHGEVAKSQGATRGSFIPRGHAGCANCHEQEIKQRCDRCHWGAREGVQLGRPDRKLSFSHARHTGLVKDCETCHPKDKQRAALVPGHSTCNTASCHRGSFKAAECDHCHQDLQRFRNKPTEFLVHGADFQRTHGAMAKQTSKACARCHDQAYCADCHQAGTALATPSILWPEKIEREFIHRGDFVSRHMIEARARPDTCFKCHGQRSCRACHALNGVAETVGKPMAGAVTRQQFHPAGWVSPGAAQFHGVQARRDIRTCASCHDRGSQSNCVTCHKVGGGGGNPHPPGWSRRNKSADCRNSPTCAACHPGGQGCR